MARTKSIPKFVRDLEPAEPGKRTTVPVPGIPGLYVRVTDKGTKTFTINPRAKGSKKQMWRSLPLALDMDHLKAADEDAVRTMAREGIARGRRGEEPFPPPPAEPDSLKTVAENWLDRHVRKNGHLSADKVQSRLERLVFPVIGMVTINEVRRKHIADLLDKIEDENGSTQAQRVYEDLRSMFAWQEGRDDDFVSPIVKALRRKKVGAGQRRRVLSDDEIRALWPILEESGAYGGMVQMLLLSGQRLEKVQQMRWDDINADGVWRIPEKDLREKANAQVLPLPQMAINVVQRMPRLVGNDYVFGSAKSGRYINGLSKAKKALDEKLQAALGADLEPWQLHGLRHTSKTLMTRARVSDFDSERVLGHAIPGIAGHYQHHDFEESNGAALERLAAEVRRIVDPPAADDTVVDMREAAQ